MAITQTATSSFKAELLLGVHDFRTAGNTFKLALYTSSASLDANTTAYTTGNEVLGANYTAGGGTLVNQGVTTAPNTSSSGAGYTNFANLTFSNSTITARGAMIYNTTPSKLSNAGATLVNPAVAILDFGSDKSSTTGDFTIIFPTPGAGTAILRVS
jgi:hypothetical protein